MSEVVSIHAPARGATKIIVICKVWDITFQSTLPHGERRRFYNDFRKSFTVSIHAPARGATTTYQTLVPPFKSFNPRSRTGSDNQFLSLRPMGSMFQSTLPHGERRFDGSRIAGVDKVSIHAPARGATRWSKRRKGSHTGFNPRSRTGSDLLENARGYVCYRFQSTLPHGERR